MVDLSNKRLNFGCGFDKMEGYDNIDVKDFDFNIFPYPIDDNTYDFILVEQVLEHLIYTNQAIEELKRICKPEGKIKIVVPHYQNRGAYVDMQHIHYFDERAFERLDNCEVKIIPTMYGIIFPRFIRDKLSLFIGGLKSQIIATITVIKEVNQAEVKNE